MPDYLTFGRYRVDAAIMRDYDFACEPLKCQERGEYCCARFEVDISRAEMERLTGLTPTAAKYARRLAGKGGQLQNPFDEFDDDPRRFVIDKSSDGDCVYTFTSGSGEKRCSVHAACLAMGLDPLREKPLPCRIWPLTLGSRGPDGKTTVTLDLQSHPVCLKKKNGKTARRKVSQGVRELLYGLFGAKVGQVVEKIETF